MADLRKPAIGVALLALVTGVGVQPPAIADAPRRPAGDAETIGSALDVTYRVRASRGEGSCRLPDGRITGDQPCAEAEIVLSTSRPLALAGREIYFSQVDPVALTSNGGAHVEHINGDLHVLRFASDVPPLQPGENRRIPFVVGGVIFTRAKVMPNYYVVDPQGGTAIIDSTREIAGAYQGRKLLPHLAPLPRSVRRSSSDLTPLETPELVGAENRDVAFVAEAVDSGIIPTPGQVERDPDGARLDLARGLTLRGDPNLTASLASAMARLEALGIPLARDGIPLVVEANSTLGPEAYRLRITGENISIAAGDPAGAFYAVQSLAALVRPGHSDIPALAIEDAPRFGFRGLHLDIARNFHGPETIRALIDQMAAYKLNRLHLHLADDEGWRLAIPGLPELTEVGARRCHDLAEDECLLPQLGSGPFAEGSGSGFLSVEDYIGLLRYASERQVEVIPSFDMPGHSRAAVRAMDARYRRLIAAGRPEEEAARFLLSDPADTTRYRSIQHYSDNTINVCRPSTYRFVGHVLDSLIAMHEQAGTPLERYHIGADETAGAWIESPICGEFLASGEGPSEIEDLGGYFIARVAKMAADRGVIAAAWSDGLSHVDPAALPDRVQSNVWGTLAGGGARTAHRHANLGWDVVLSIPDALYFDMPYSAHPEEGGYDWAIRRAPTRKLFSMMPENLPALAAYWRDRDERPLTIDDRPGSKGEADYRPLDEGEGFAGIQGHLWTETIRDRETLGYQLFPRMFALAERAWHRAPWEIPYDRSGARVGFGDPSVGADRRAAMTADWNRFGSIVGAKELPKLAASGWSFRLPTVGVVDDGDGVLQTRVAIPGLLIQCDGGRGWTELHKCEPGADGQIRLRTALTPDGPHGRAVSVDPAGGRVRPGE